MVRKTVPQRNNIHKKRIAVVVCGGKWLLEGAGVEVAKVGGQVGGEGGVRNQRFTGEDAPGHAEFLVFPSLPQQGPAELALKHIPVLTPPPSCQSGCEVLDPLQLHDVELLVRVPCAAAVLKDRSHQHLIQVRQTAPVSKPETSIEEAQQFLRFAADVGNMWGPA